MNQRKTARRTWGWICVFVAGGTILLACRVFTRSAPSLSAQSDDGIDVRNGEIIYFTARSKRNSKIDYTGGPAFGGMMMGAIPHLRGVPRT